MGQRMVVSRPELASLHLPLSPVPCAPFSDPSGGAGEKQGLRHAGEGWMRKEATGSPPPHRPETMKGVDLVPQPLAMKGVDPRPR